LDLSGTWETGNRSHDNEGEPDFPTFGDISSVTNMVVVVIVFALKGKLEERK